MQDPQKIINKINELNRKSWEESGRPALTQVPQIWQEFVGYNALTKFDYNNGSPLFSPSIGVPIKAFLNTRTGEIRVFIASIFEQ